MQLLITEGIDITQLLEKDCLKKFKLLIGNIRLGENSQSAKKEYLVDSRTYSRKIPPKLYKDAEINNNWTRDTTR